MNLPLILILVSVAIIILMIAIFIRKILPYLINKVELGDDETRESIRKIRESEWEDTNDQYDPDSDDDVIRS